MKVLVVLAHPEHQSFNGAMFRTAVEELAAAGHEVKTSDLHAVQFDPVSGRHNFLSARDPDYFKQQIEEMHATETYGFAEDLEEEILSSEVGDDALLDLTVFAVGFDDADVFVDGAAGRADLDGSRVHENQYHDELQRIQG